MTWLILLLIVGLVLFNVPATKPHAQSAWDATWTWIKGFKIKLWMVLVAILVATLVWPQGLTVVRNRTITAWNAINGASAATATPAPKQESAPTTVDSQKVYDAAKEGAKEGATEAVKAEAPKVAEAAKNGASEGVTKAIEAATPKVAEAAKSGAKEGATEAVESKPTPPATPAPAPASPPTQPAPQPQTPVVGPSGYTDGQLAILGKVDAELAATAAKASADVAQKAKDDTEAIVVKAEAAVKAAEAAADKADDAADRSATNADVAKKATEGAKPITEISTSLGKISIDRSVSGVLRLSVVSSSISSVYPSGRRVWIEQERTANVVDNILLVGKIGTAFSSRDFQIGVTGVTGRYRIWIEDPSGGFRAPNGTLVSVSDWASIK